MSTVILIIRLAILALQACSNLSTNPHTISHFCGAGLVAGSDDASYDLMPNADW